MWHSHFGLGRNKHHFVSQHNDIDNDFNIDNDNYHNDTCAYSNLERVR